MNKFAKFISIIAISTTLAACGGGSDDTPEGSVLGTCTELSNWNNLKIGMGTGPVKRYLGEPSSISGDAKSMKYTYEVCRVFTVVDEKATEEKEATYTNMLMPGTVTFSNNYVSAISTPTSPEGKTLVRELTPAEVRQLRAQKGYR